MCEAQPVRCTDARILTSDEISAGIFRLTLDIGSDISAEPGQFAHISIPGFTLRRPISIAGLSEGILELMIQPVGDGTRRLVSLSAGHKLSVMLPLGRPFPMDMALNEACSDHEIWLAAGGIGAAPLMMCADRLAEAGVRVRSFMGFRDEKFVFGLERFSACGRVVKQIGGLITDPVSVALSEDRPALIFACGPRPFLRAMQRLSLEYGVKCFASFEEAMGCGIGACLTCSCAVSDDRGGISYARVCRDGPVFDLERAVFE